MEIKILSSLNYEALLSTINEHMREKRDLYLKSLSSALLTSLIIALLEVFLAPWSYFPSNSLYIDMYIFRYDLHLYDLLFTWPLYFLGSFFVYLRSRRFLENLGEGTSNVLLSMVVEEILYFSLQGRLPCLEDPTTTIIGCIPLDNSCIPIWWIFYVLPTIYTLKKLFRDVK
ncbi:MAG: hypothetical protein C0200_00430 [Thermoproteota archaeon]|jgi:hypothetical protein|nr:MAG: hypothetical protein C0200_00430 [Candidatus Korarchaeota archaeon]